MNRGDLSQTYRDAAGELDPALLAAQRREQHHETLVHNLNMRGADDARSVGIRATGAGELRDAAGVGGETEEQRRRREFEQAAIRAHERYVQMLEEEMERLQGQIEDNDRLLRLLRNGQFDRNNDDHITLVISLGLDPNLSDEDLDSAARSNGRALRGQLADVAGVHRRATNPQNETEREQVIEEVRQWEEAGEPDLAIHLTASLDNPELAQQIDDDAGLDEARQIITQGGLDAPDGDDDFFSGGLGGDDFEVGLSATGSQTSFAAEVDHAQGVSSPGSDAAADTDQTASPAVTNDPDDDPENNNGAGGPTGPVLGGAGP